MRRNMYDKPVKARRLGEYQGTRFYAWTVQVTLSDITGTAVIWTDEITAPTHSEALWAVRQDPEFLDLLRVIYRPVELITWGVQGGKRAHFLGWESVTSALMAGGSARGHQLTMALGV